MEEIYHHKNKIKYENLKILIDMFYETNLHNLAFPG